MCEVTVTLQLINLPFISEKSPMAISSYIIGILKVQRFKNPITGTIYSFNYLKNKFIQPNKHSQTYLNEMLF
jgi:hypothetical protein